MRLKYLSLCLLGLSLSACSSHVIKTNTSPANSIEQRAANGVNAMYEYSSYDYNGRFNVALDIDQSKKSSLNSTTQQPLDTRLEKQINDYLKAQNIALTSQQKQDLYQAIAKKDRTSSSKTFEKFGQSIMDLISTMQFSYDGSVHYKEKLASLNLTAKYEKPTLLVQAKVPMVLDFQNHKFYTNYFALMPYLVNKESQNSFAYIDFSKYKHEIDRVDFKKLVAYLKQSTALPYLLADHQQIQNINLSAQDKEQGMVEKIRLNVSLEEMLLQMRLFELVNKPYFAQSIVGISNAEQAKDATKTIEGTDDESSDDLSGLATYGMSAAEAEAYRSSKKLYKLVSQRFGHDDEAQSDSETEIDEEATATAEVVSNESDTVIATQTGATTSLNDSEEETTEDGYLTKTQCEALITQKTQVTMGDLTFCNAEYRIDVLNKDAQSKQKPTIFSTDATALDHLFEQYASTDFKDAETFKQLWNKHHVEIEKYLSDVKPLNPFVIDVGLDVKGRAVKMDYDVAYSIQDLGKFKLKADMNVLNYGQGTAINRAELKNAKSIEEVSKGSMLENMVKGFSKSLGVSDTDKSKSKQNVVASLDDQLEQLATQVYDHSKSYIKTYQAVFIMKLTAEQPDVVKHYSTQELNEIARVYAYGYAGESIYNPKGKELAELESLGKKHHIERSEQYDDEVGEETYNIVVKAINGTEGRQEWNTFVQQYKQPQAIFAQYYYQQFLKDEDLDPSQKASLKATSQILAKAFEDSRKNQLTMKSIENLKEESTEYIDYDLYRTVYEKIQKSVQ